MSAAKSILMIRPAAFDYNPQTAINNKFQRHGREQNIQSLALEQFDYFVSLLKRNEIEVQVFPDTFLPLTPDAIFPNNWISFHQDGTVVLYPMFAKNRRQERRMDLLVKLASNYRLLKTVDLTYYEAQQYYLEGTGSFVLDHQTKRAYMCLSQRSSIIPFQTFCGLMGYDPLVFEGQDKDGYPIYHTNVMMCIGSSFVVLCTEAIRDKQIREEIIHSFQQAKKELIDITFQQMACFAGNMIELSNKSEERLLVMSEQAFRSLTQEQRLCLEKHARLLYAPLDVIESNGGGSARCMIAEIFLPLKNTDEKPF